MVVHMLALLMNISVLAPGSIPAQIDNAYPILINVSSFESVQ